MYISILQRRRLRQARLNDLSVDTELVGSRAMDKWDE